ncbi:MAG: helix-turn-helix domain-containing protein [Haemophilus pittmaniae]|uniref:helix-turn-helix domain-containing protein n=1 Tax=Haemophilus pittmaniae TaxID=249188 RepID=UPI0023F529EC|nr:helix-turn-helix domain-containing protein [Haemophilus pittmaniae]MBS6026335.1 helix-turn-helix domain-containing protein [Haemophilus pittmaniae]
MGNINLNDQTSQSQCATILRALRNGERLTQLDAYSRFNCTRLGARIYDLKKRGHNIISKMITVPSGKRVAQYWLEA